MQEMSGKLDEDYSLRNLVRQQQTWCEEGWGQLRAAVLLAS
jgi:hypothetical protein